MAPDQHVFTDDPTAYLKRRRFEELMSAGTDAYRKGERRLAHDYWREAATLDPYSERVWLALFRVLESEEDRIACLHNIIAINPMNVQARRRLNTYDERPAQPATPPRQTERAKAKPTGAAKQRTAATRKAGKKPVKKPRRTTRWLPILLIAAFVLGLLLVVIAIITTYGL